MLLLSLPTLSRTGSVCLPAMRSRRLASALDFVSLRNNHDSTRRRSGRRQRAFRGVSILGTSRGGSSASKGDAGKMRPGLIRDHRTCIPCHRSECRPGGGDLPRYRARHLQTVLRHLETMTGLTFHLHRGSNTASVRKFKSGEPPCLLFSGYRSSGWSSLY